MKHLKRNWLPVFQCIFCPEKGSSPLVSHKPLKNYGIIGGILHFFLQNIQPQDSDTASTSFNWFQDFSVANSAGLQEPNDRDALESKEL